MYKLNLLDKVSIILVVLGALNWGLYGLFNLDLVHAIFGGQLQLIARIIYILIGAAGLYLLLLLFKAKKQ